MTETIEAAAGTIIDRYVAVWNEPDAQSRRAAIGSLWEPDGVEYVEGGIQFRGHEELDGRIARAYDEFVGSGKFHATLAEDASRHDDLVTFTVQLSTDEGEVAWAARVFVLLGETGRIREDYQLTVKPLAAYARNPLWRGRVGFRPGRAPGPVARNGKSRYQDSRSVSASRTDLPSIWRGIRAAGLSAARP